MQAQNQSSTEALNKDIKTGLANKEEEAFRLEHKSEFQDFPWKKVELGIFHPDERKKTSKLPFYPYWASLEGQEGQVSRELKVINIMNEKTWKIHINFKHIKTIHYEQEPDNGLKHLYFELNYSPFFHKYIGGKWNNGYVRSGHLGLQNEEKLYKEFLIRYTVIKVSCQESEGYKTFLNVLKVTGSKIQPCNNLNLPYLTEEILENSALNFEIKFALLACLSHKKAIIFDLNKEFMDRLQSTKLDAKVIEKTLKDLARSPRREQDHQNPFHSFEKLFDLLYEQRESSKSQWENIVGSDALAVIKSVTITPTLVNYSIGNVSLSNSILRRFQDRSEFFIRMHIRDELGELIYSYLDDFGDRFSIALRELKILERTYEPLAYSISQLRKNSLWMCAKKDGAQSFAEEIRKDIGYLGKIPVVAKYGARLGQLLSASFMRLNINANTTKVIEDKKPINHDSEFSDGIGKISRDLIEKIREKGNIKEKVCAIQIRLGKAKGVLVMDPTLEDDKICIRESMMKWDQSAFDLSLDVMNYNKFYPVYLERKIIILLSELGINEEVFLELQEENIADLTKNNINKTIVNYIDNRAPLAPITELLTKCFDRDINMTQDPFLKGIIDVMTIRSLMNTINLNHYGPLVKKGALLLGILDEYDILEEDEVYVSISRSNGEDENDIEVINSDVVVTKTPCLYPGDIRRLKAVGQGRVGNKFDHIVNCIVFPAKGKRPIPDQIIGSDLDGDMYFVSWDPRLIPEKTVAPLSYDPKEIDAKYISRKKPKKKTPEGLDDVWDFFYNFMPNNKVGVAINIFLSNADLCLHKKQKLTPECEILARAFGIFIDYAKTGVNIDYNELKTLGQIERPSYLKKNDFLCQTYESNSIIAQLMKKFKAINEKDENKIVKEFCQQYKKGLVEPTQVPQIDERMIFEGFEKYLEKAFKALEIYNEETLAFMYSNGIRTEYEVYSGSFLKFTRKDKYNHKELSDIEKLQEETVAHIESIKLKTGKLLHEDLNELKKDSKNKELRKIASAVYIASYYNETCEIKKVNDAIKNYKNNYKPGYKPQMLGLPWYLFKDEIIELLAKPVEEK